MLIKSVLSTLKHYVNIIISPLLFATMTMSLFRKTLLPTIIILNSMLMEGTSINNPTPYKNVVDYWVRKNKVTQEYYSNDIVPRGCGGLCSSSLYEDNIQTMPLEKKWPKWITTLIQKYTQVPFFHQFRHIKNLHFDTPCADIITSFGTKIVMWAYGEGLYIYNYAHPETSKVVRILNHDYDDFCPIAMAAHQRKYNNNSFIGVVGESLKTFSLKSDDKIVKKKPTKLQTTKKKAFALLKSISMKDRRPSKRKKTKKENKSNDKSYKMILFIKGEHSRQKDIRYIVFQGISDSDNLLGMLFSNDGKYLIAYGTHFITVYDCAHNRKKLYRTKEDIYIQSNTLCTYKKNLFFVREKEGDFSIQYDDISSLHKTKSIANNLLKYYQGPSNNSSHRSKSSSYNSLLKTEHESKSLSFYSLSSEHQQYKALNFNMKVSADKIILVMSNDRNHTNIIAFISKPSKSGSQHKLNFSVDTNFSYISNQHDRLDALGLIIHKPMLRLLQLVHFDFSYNKLYMGPKISLSNDDYSLTYTTFVFDNIEYFVLLENLDYKGILKIYG